MQFFEADNPHDVDELTNERDVIWFCKAIRGDFGQYVMEGPYDIDGQPFMVARKINTTQRKWTRKK